jgi:hypothetical protein
MRGPQSAKQIPDLEILRVVSEVKQPGTSWCMFSMVCAAFPLFCEKVVRAKLHALIRRKLIVGCVCGCRGDFEVTSAGMDVLFSSVDPLTSPDRQLQP